MKLKLRAYEQVKPDLPSNMVAKDQPPQEFAWIQQIHKYLHDGYSVQTALLGSMSVELDKRKELPNDKSIHTSRGQGQALHWSL